MNHSFCTRILYCLLRARLFAGAGSGMCPMFLTEIAPVNIRGAMGVLHQCGLVCGILFAQVGSCVFFVFF